MKQVTIKDIAREAGVSIASVSRALNGMDGISEENRSRILRVCERLSYTPNGLARSLVKRRTQTIGIIMPDIMSPFYSELMVKARMLPTKRVSGIIMQQLPGAEGREGLSEASGRAPGGGNPDISHWSQEHGEHG